MRIPIRLSIYLIECAFAVGGSVLTAGSILAQAGKTQIPYVLPGRPGIWSGGAFVTVDDNNGLPLIRAVNKGGELVSQIEFTIPGARSASVFSGMFARGFDGSFVLAGGAYADDDRAAAFLAWLSADGQRQTIVRPYPFIPSVVTMAADGSIWAAGREVQEDDRNLEKPDYNIVRRYDRTGRLLGSFISRSSLQLKPGSLSPGEYSYLVASRDRVGWYSQVAGKYFEFSPDGSSVQEFATAAAPGVRLHLTGAALCGDGTVVVSAEARAVQSETAVATWRVLELLRDRGTWLSIAGDSTKYVKVAGCDGTTVAFGPGVTDHLDWFTITQR